MHGLKNVSHRHDDALSRIGWAELERLLATYYREVGWWVEHIGTGGTGAKTDGGVDLRLRRNDEVVLVQCKHWNAKQVPHNAVHELLGVMVNEGATGAILVSSGEFTRAAIEAAQRHGKVKLIDGDALRRMLGTLPDESEPGDPSTAAATAVSAPRARRRARPRAAQGRPWLWWIALVAAIGFVLIVHAMLARTADTAVAPPPDPPRAVTPTIVIHAPVPVATPSAPPPPPRAPTESEIRESQRKADEAMKLIEDSTPEM